MSRDRAFERAACLGGVIAGLGGASQQATVGSDQDASMRVAMIGSGLCGSGVGRLLRGIRSRGHLRRQGSQQDRAPWRPGEIPIFEPGLDDLVARSVRQAACLRRWIWRAPWPRTRCSSPSARRAVAATAMPTSVLCLCRRRGDRRPADGFTVVVTKSTVPVGTGDEVERIIRKTNPDAQFAVVSNPEFLREGAAIEDFKRPDRVVVGTEDERARGDARDLSAAVPEPRPRSSSPAAGPAN
jgi:UDPglucose 6-dehydrogenase